MAAALGGAHRALCQPLTSLLQREDGHSWAKPELRSESTGLRMGPDLLTRTNVTQQLRKFESISWDSSRTNSV